MIGQMIYLSPAAYQTLTAIRLARRLEGERIALADLLREAVDNLFELAGSSREQ